MNNEYDDLLKAFKPRFIEFLQLVGPLKKGRVPKGGDYKIIPDGEVLKIEVLWATPLLDGYKKPNGEILTDKHSVGISIALTALEGDAFLDELKAKLIKAKLI